MRLHALLSFALALSLACAAVAAGCTRASAPATADAGPSACGLFGIPTAQTGLGSDACRPACTCDGGTFAPPAYDDAFVRALVEDWALAVPFAPLASDPYAGAVPQPDPPDTVCAVVPQGEPAAKPRRYALATFPSEAAAGAAGAAVTHFGRCGVCSTLVDLAAYMRHVDLTAPVRACAFETPADGGTPLEADVACLQRLGFDLPCAQIWAYDTAHTRGACLEACVVNLSAPYHLPDGGLNPCLQCDEDASGPVFQAVAGRTRRNSGLPNAICRPCAEVRPLVHAY